jgi:hypothetical protein
VRPTWVRGVLNAVRVAKLEVEVSSPTRHDADVLTSLAWSGPDRDAQQKIDRALDVEVVTRRFYLGLAEHHERLPQAVREASDANAAVLNGIKRARGSRAGRSSRAYPDAVLLVPAATACESTN